MEFLTFFTQQLTLNISNFPTYPGPFKCNFSGYNVTRETKANRPSANANTLTCETPYPNELPQFPVDTGKFETPYTNELPQFPVNTGKFETHMLMNCYSSQ